MPSWLDSWTSTRRLSQFQASKRFAERGQHTIDVVQNVPRLYPIEHTKLILQFGKRAYRKWESEGFPDNFMWERIP